MRRAVSFRPSLVPARVNLACGLKLAGRLDEAGEHLRIALKHQPKSADLAGKLGTVYHAQRKFEQAATLLRQAVSKLPERADLWNDLGSVLADLGRLDEAGECFDKALTLEPDNIDTQLETGSADSGWTGASEFVWLATVYRRLGFTAQPKYLEIAESSGYVDLWERRGPPDFCAKAGGEWVCE